MLTMKYDISKDFSSIVLKEVEEFFNTEYDIKHHIVLFYDEYDAFEVVNEIEPVLGIKKIIVYRDKEAFESSFVNGALIIRARSKSNIIDFLPEDCRKFPYYFSFRSLSGQNVHTLQIFSEPKIEGSNLIYTSPIEQIHTTFEINNDFVEEI